MGRADGSHPYAKLLNLKRNSFFWSSTEDSAFQTNQKKIKKYRCMGESGYLLWETMYNAVSEQE